MNHRRRRLELLEKRIFREPILLHMPDDKAAKLNGHPHYILDLMMRCLNGESLPEMELIAQSIRSDEPGDAHMVDMARLLYGATKNAMARGTNEPSI